MTNWKSTWRYNKTAVLCCGFTLYNIWRNGFTYQLKFWNNFKASVRYYGVKHQWQRNNRRIGTKVSTVFPFFDKELFIKGMKKLRLKSVHFKKPVTWSSFLSKSFVIFNITTTNMTTLFERNEDRVTGFLKWTDFKNN